MVTVERRGNESLERLMRRVLKEVQHERVLTVARRRRFFEKPSVQRKRKAAKKLAKSRKITRKMHPFLDD